jgi:hypothetical protein
MTYTHTRARARARERERERERERKHREKIRRTRSPDKIPAEYIGIVGSSINFAITLRYE